MEVINGFLKPVVIH